MTSYVENAVKHVLEVFQKQWQHGANYGTIINHLVDRRVQRHDNGDNLDVLLSCLLRDKKSDPRNLKPGEIEAEVGVIIKFPSAVFSCIGVADADDYVNAGSDITAVALTNVVFYLIKNPRVLCKPPEGVAGAFTEEDKIARCGKVKNLPYLKACLDESLRLSPPVSFGLNCVPRSRLISH